MALQNHFFPPLAGSNEKDQYRTQSGKSHPVRRESQLANTKVSRKWVRTIVLRAKIPGLVPLTPTM